jgi:hypothetical protein
VLVKGELMTLDKPAFIRDLLWDGEVREGPIQSQRSDRVFDATGVSRAYLPPIRNDVLLPAKQRRIETSERLENRIKLGGVGYAWCFPLGRMGYHLGCGSLSEDPARQLEALGWAPDSSTGSSAKTRCACSGSLRLTGPHDSQPFFLDGPSCGVWGVGEAIGCVAPLAGDGIVPGMKSVRLLMEHWEDPEAYTGAVLREFDWMKGERQVIDKILTASPLGIKDAWVLRKNSKRMAMQLGLKEAIRFLRALKNK